MILENLAQKGVSMKYSSNVDVKEKRVTVAVEDDGRDFSVSLVDKLMALAIKHNATDYYFSFEDWNFSANCDSLEDLNDLASELSECMEAA